MLDFDEALAISHSPAPPEPPARMPFQRMLDALDFLGLGGAQVELQSTGLLAAPHWHVWFGDGASFDLPHDLVVASPEQAAYTIRDRRKATRAA